MISKRNQVRLRRIALFFSAKERAKRYSKRATALQRKSFSLRRVAAFRDAEEHLLRTKLEAMPSETDEQRREVDLVWQKLVRVLIDIPSSSSLLRRANKAQKKGENLSARANALRRKV